MIEVQLSGNNQITVNGATSSHRTPICHAARVLAGTGETGMAVATRAGKHALYFDISKTAGLTVTENENEGPRFSKYVKFDRSFLNRRGLEE